MFGRFLPVARKDQRDATVAFLTLFGVMAAHAVLETARDALFLSRLPASRLPWAYIGIAVLSLVAVQAGRRLGGTLSRRLVLSVSLVVGGGITAAFQPFLDGVSVPALFALYVWTGLLASVVVVEFWLLVARVLDIGQAKRLFSVIAAGGLAGAILGSVLAAGLLMVLPPASLVTVAAALLGITAIGPPFFSPSRGPGADRTGEAAVSTLTSLRREPYLLRLLAVALASSMLLTGVDYLFKATAAIDLAPEQLGPFFARFHAAIGVVALLVQVFVSPRLLRVVGVNGSLLLLPSLLLLGSAAFVVLGGLGAAIWLRGTDGALRHSVHRTGMEILYIPLRPAVRERSKALIEALGQRGGQALASVLLLAALPLGVRLVDIGIALVLVAGVWLTASASIRPHYLELFRTNLREGALEAHIEVSDLDLHAVEVLVGALGSENDLEVLAALDLLAQNGKTGVIPALVLYHPSPEVVLRAFQHFATSGRQDIQRPVVRLIRHEDERVRAAALRYYAARADAALLDSMSEDPSPLVRTTAVVELIRRGTIAEALARQSLDGIIDHGTPELRRSLAIAARDLPHGTFAWVLVRLASVDEPGLAVEVASSMGAAPDPAYAEALVALLARRDCRQPARAAILALGSAALDALGKTLADPALPRSIRRHVPRTIARLGTPEAARLLEERLAVEPDELVALRIAGSLGRMRAKNPALPVDRRALEDQARSTLERAVTVLFFRVTEQLASRLDGPEASPASEMIAALLTDIEATAMERVFRVLTIIDPSEEFEVLFAGLRSDDARVRENGRELLAHVVQEPLRGGILAMLGDGSEEERLAHAARFHEPKGRPRLERAIARLAPGLRAAGGGPTLELGQVHSDNLRAMLQDASVALRGLARHRLTELGLEPAGASLTPPAGRASSKPPPRLESDEADGTEQGEGGRAG